MNIIVFGSGLAGLAVALGLVSKQNDICVNIIEKRSQFDRRGATFGLAPNGQVALRELCPDALRHLQTVGIPMENSNGYMLPWWEVHDSLLNEARQHGDRISIHMGMQVDQVRQHDDGVTVNFQHSDLVLEGDVLIGADGVRSQIRTEILGLPPAVPTGTFTWRGRMNVTNIPALQHLLDIRIGSSDVFGSKLLLFYFNFHDTLPGTIAWTARTQSKSIIPGVTTPMDILEEYLQESIHLVNDNDVERRKIETAKEIFRHSLQIDLTCSSELSVIDLKSGWGGSGRITLIGDAAHAVRPYSGLGGAVAFEDAVVLSRLLAKSAAMKSRHPNRNDNDNTVVDALRQFEKQRLPRVRSISDDQTMRSESFYRKGASIPPWSDAYRDWIFAGPDAPSEPPQEPSLLAQI